MPTLDINFEDVPDVILPVEPGIYDMLIVEAPTYEETADKKSMKLVVKLSVENDGPMKGRKMTDNISIKMETKIKNLIMSAGLAPVKGFDTSELAGKIVKAEVVNRPYTPPGGTERQVGNVEKYLFEAKA